MDIQHRQRPVKPDQSFWDNRRMWTARIFSMLCCVLVVSVVAVFCAFVYLIMKELRTERVIGEDGSEVSLLGFWSVLVMSVLSGVCCCSFTWTITYFDSFEPSTFPPTPLSPAHLRRVTGHSFHMGYSVAVLNGIVAAITVFSLPLVPTLEFRMPHTGKPVVIPPELPGILKQFTKDAIRTQPEDLLEWATLYFSALVQGKTLPVNRTADKVITPNTMDLTPEVLTTMHKKLHEKSTVSKEEVSKLWQSLGLADDLLRHIMTVGCFGDELDWIKFFALGCSYLGGTIKNAMTHALYILNSDSSCKPPDACVTLETFCFLYSYLAAVDREVSQAQIDRTITYLEAQAKARDGMVKVSDFVNSRKVRLG